MSGVRAARARTELTEQWREQSYFIVRGFASAAEVLDLRTSCDAVLAHHRRTSRSVGHTSTYVEGLLDPLQFVEEPQRLDRLIAFFGSPRVCALLQDLALPSEGTLWLKALQYFHEQTLRDFRGAWHRDSQFGRGDSTVEKAFALNSTAVRFRVALLPDDCLEIVPGSHRRWDTEQELAIRKGTAPHRSVMPGAQRIALQPGDACAFHAWTIHRATYVRAPLRRTLDGLFRFGRTPAPFDG